MRVRCINCDGSGMVDCYGQLSEDGDFQCQQCDGDGFFYDDRDECDDNDYEGEW